MLLLAGEQDRLAPDSVMRKIALKYVPRATYQRLSGHAHWLPAERGWQAVAGRIHTWLDRTL